MSQHFLDVMPGAMGDMPPRPGGRFFQFAFGVSLLVLGGSQLYTYQLVASLRLEQEEMRDLMKQYSASHEKFLSGRSEGLPTDQQRTEQQPVPPEGRLRRRAQYAVANTSSFRNHAVDADTILVDVPLTSPIHSDAAALINVPFAAHVNASTDARWQGFEELAGRITTLEAAVGINVSAGPSEAEDLLPASRRLSNAHTVGTSAHVGCFQLARGTGHSTEIEIDVSADDCNGAPCPFCFITKAEATSDETDTGLKIMQCGQAKFGSRGMTNVDGVYMYTFINVMHTATLNVRDDSGGNVVMWSVKPQSYAYAFCAGDNVWALSSVPVNRLLWMTTYMPQLTLGPRTYQSDFATEYGMWSVEINRATGIEIIRDTDDPAQFNTFSSTLASHTLKGNVEIGEATGVDFFHQAYGEFVVKHDTGGAEKFKVDRAGNIYMNGNVEVAANFDLVMASGTGVFTTGTGAVTLNGDTTVTAGGTFTTGTGAVTLNGATEITADKTFTTNTGIVTLGANVAILGTSTFTTGSGAVALDGDVAIASGMTLTTGTGGLVTLNGNTVISGSYYFTSGTGDVTLNGNTYVADTKVLTTGTGNVNINGITTIDASSANPLPSDYGLKVSSNVYIDSNSYLKMDPASTGTFETGTGAVKLKGATEVEGTSFTVDEGMTTNLFGPVFIGQDVNSKNVAVTIYGDFYQEHQHHTIIHNVGNAANPVVGPSKSTFSIDLETGRNSNIILAASSALVLGTDVTVDATSHTPAKFFAPSCTITGQTADTVFGCR